MSTGAILIGLAALVALASYVVQPFRRSPSDLDALIEHWVADARKDVGQTAEAALRSEASSEGNEVAEPATTSQSSVANYCHNCGRLVKPSHHFCPNCGTRLDDA